MMQSTIERGEESWGESRFLRNAVKFGLGAIVLIFYATVILHFDYSPDDTYIYLRFAKNILQGSGFAFNPGEPTYGVTSPLWTLLITAGGWFGTDLALAAKGLDLVLASLAVILFYVLALEVIRERLLAFLATFSFSVNVWLLRWAASGMETSLGVLLVLVTVFYCLRNDYLVAAVACSLFTLVRPEGIGLFALLIVDAFLNSVEKRHALKVAVTSAIIYLVVLLPWLVFAWLNFGTFVPNTALAKSGLDFDFSGSASSAITIGKTIALSSVVEFLLFIAAVALIVKRKQSIELRQHNLPLAWVVLLNVVYIAAGVDVVSRYLLVVLPFVTVYGFFGLRKLLELRRSRPGFEVAAALAVTAVILVQNQYVYHVYVKDHLVQFSQGVEDCLSPIARWLRENTPAQAVVVAPDVGVIGYYSERKVCDLAGLITPEMKRLRKQGLTYDEVMTKHLFLPICYPDYVVDRAQVPDRLSDDQFVPMMTRTFHGLGLSKPALQYYTLYKVKAGIFPTTGLTHRREPL